MRLAETVLKLGDELHRATTNGRGLDFQGRTYVRPVEFGPWTGKKTLPEFLGLDLTELAPVIREEIAQTLKTYRKATLFCEGVNLKALRWLQEMVGRAQAYLVARKDPERPIELRRVVNPVPDKWRGRLIVLDATAHPPVIERALKRPGMQVLDVRVPLEVKTAYLKRSVSKTGIIRARGRNVALKALKEALKVIKAEKILVFCHQAIKAQVEEATAQDNRQIVIAHHFGTETRGTNQFADFGGVILLGLPVPNPGAYYDVALALRLSADEWEAWLDLLARAESWQEACRIRPILAPGKEVLVIGPRWPFKEWLGPPQEMIEPEEIRGALALASKVLLIWLDIFRFIYIEIALFLGIGRPDQIPPAEVQAELWQRIKEVYPKEVESFFLRVQTLYKSTGNPFACPDASQEVPESERNKGFPPLYKYSLKSTGNSLLQAQEGSSGNYKGFPPLFKEIQFTDRKWWPKLLARLRKEHPELPVFEVQIRTPGGLQRTRGLGDLEAAKAFCRAVGLKTNDDAWRYVNA